MLKQDRSTDPFRSDIRSHGVVVWEVTTGQMPWQGQSIIVILNGVGNNGWALQMPQDSAPALITVFNKCCVVDPKKRIAFNEITQILQSAVDQAEASGFTGLSVQSMW